MVYRLHRASKFLRVRIFAVLFIYAIIIGIAGLFVLNFVVIFDTESFTPQLVDTNENNNLLNTLNSQTDNTDLSTDTILLCDNYRGENCPWLLYDDLMDSLEDRELDEERDFLIDLEIKSQNKEYLLLEEIDINRMVFGAPQIFIFGQKYSTTYDNPVQSNEYPQKFNDGVCFSLQQGNLCEGINLGVDFQIEYNLREYYNLQLDNTFLGSHVLIHQATNEILCENYNARCEYYPSENLSDQKYTYFDYNENQDINVSAYQAIVAPNKQISSVTNQDDLGSFINTICVINDNSCNGIIDFIDPYNSGKLTFIVKDQAGDLWVAKIRVFSALSPSDDSMIFPYNKINNQNSYTICDIYHSDENSQFALDNYLGIGCSSGSTEGTGPGRTFSFIDNPLFVDDDSPATANVKLVFHYDEQTNKFFVKFATFLISVEGTPSFDIIVGIFSSPRSFMSSLLNNDITRLLLPFIITFFAVNVILSFLLILIKFWKIVGGWVGIKIPLMLRGKTGRLLELTQFFEFRGQWYLEIHGIYDYNFRTTMGVVHELVNERWRDTIFFPTALAASISILVFTINPDPFSLIALFVISGFLPILLAFWIPSLWIMQDSGLKRVQWSNTGELLVIERISENIRDGFNKLVGFGAIFGIGTAGAALARAEIAGSSISSLSVFTGGLESLLSFQWNFLISAVLWTIALLLLVTSVSMIGNIMVSLSYLNSGHLENVKKTRTKLQERDIFLGTTQQVMDHSGNDISIYYDSKTGINELYDSSINPKITAPRPKPDQEYEIQKVSTVDTPMTDEEVTKIIIEESDQDEIFKLDPETFLKKGISSISILEDVPKEEDSSDTEQSEDDQTENTSANDNDEHQE